MTGEYPARLHLTDWLPGRKATPFDKLKGPAIAQELPPGVATFADEFKKAGYRTALMGKWHLGPSFPEKHGFDVNIGGCELGHPNSYFSPYHNPKLPDGPKGEYLTDRLTDDAVKFIEESKDQPFLLYLAHYTVHIPLEARPDLLAKYKAKKAGMQAGSGPEFLPEGDYKVRQVQDVAVYGAMVESLDESVGRVMAKLKELGLDQKTVVIFFSDNGGLSTAQGWPTSNLPLRGGKGWNYEGGIREPLSVKWPGVTKAGSVCGEPVISTDFYPTLMEMAGLRSARQGPMDGVSLAPVLKGEKMADRPLFWHYPHYSDQGGRPSGVVRDGEYKLIERYEDMGTELYDLKDDPGEKTDLASQMPGKVAELRGMLHGWRKEVDAAMPVANPIYQKEKANGTAMMERLEALQDD